MRECRVVSDSALEDLEIRHLNLVCFRHIAGSVSAVPNVSTQCSEELFSALNAFNFRPRRLLGQLESLYLRSVKNRVAACEDRSPGLLFFLLLIFRVLVAFEIGEFPEHNKRSSFSFLHVCAELIP